MRRFALAGLVLVASCTSEPHGILQPSMYRVMGSQVGNVIMVTAWPRDINFRVGEGRVPIDILTSSGDSERVGLTRQYCPERERAWHYQCFQFRATMESGHFVSELDAPVRAAGGRVNLGSGATITTITVFTLDNFARFAHEVSTWQGVFTTSLIRDGGCPGEFLSFEDVYFCPNLSNLALPVPVDSGTVARGNGHIEAAANAVITIRYVRPGDADVVTSFVLK